MNHVFTTDLYLLKKNIFYIYLQPQYHISFANSNRCYKPNTVFCLQHILTLSHESSFLNYELNWTEVAQSGPTLCDPVDNSPQGSSVHGILQARILEWVAISFSKGSSQPRDRTQASRIVGRCFNLWAPREAPTIAPFDFSVNKVLIILISLLYPPIVDFSSLLEISNV